MSPGGGPNPNDARVLPSVTQIAAAIRGCMLRDQHRFRRALNRLGDARRASDTTPAALQRLWQAVQDSQARCRARRASVPALRFPEALPVSQAREQLAATIRAHQVVVVAGETGSGKTTQLPKICLLLGRGAAGLIGHTQPRRIAARSVATRIAAELGSEAGGAVGYKVRFSDQVGADAYIKVMTDGILLAEIQGDRFLEQYDTIIIDEAHERSLNIDFLLGYLKRLLPKRPELKLIITSATIDPQRLARHFGAAPVIEVSGRTYPVEVRYRPLPDPGEGDAEAQLQQAILDAVDETARVGPGDALVFLPGEREIRETAEALRKHHPPHTEVLPLYARLSAAEQQRVFAPHQGRRIVLATNVAETSLTVPGIRYVIDPGIARISRYSYRTKVQRLPVEPVSQASANQRKGRCGRVSAGLCIRLYTEDDFNQRPAFTEPELLRSNLAAVILQMQALNLGDIGRFPFVDAPDPRYVNDGFRLLLELGAIDGQHRLTELGRQLARLPVDPRLGRMVLAARGEHCLTEVLIIASALTIQDPRERPLDTQAAADEQHARFQHPESDFLAWVHLWTFIQAHKRHLTRSKLRQFCRDNFLSYTRLREWEDVHGQLYTLVRELGLRPNELPAEYDAVHRALLTGLLGNVAVRAGLEAPGGSQDAEAQSTPMRPRPSVGDGYQGARGSSVHIFPGSGLFGKKPKWIVAGEIVATRRTYARTVARVEPEWIEQVARHLVRRSYLEPHWERRRAEVIAYERVSLYGLVLQAKRPVNYAAIDPQEARSIFIRAALIEGDYRSQAYCLRHNQALVREVEALEAKSRRRDILVDDELLFQFYADRLPADVCTGAAFERWLRAEEPHDREVLCLRRADLMRHQAAEVTTEQFPEALELDGLRVALEYHFEPGAAVDGVTATIPIAALQQVSAVPFEWLVPGLLRDKVAALIRSLPKSLRRHFVPAPDFATACVEALAAGDRPLLEALAGELERMTGVEVPPDAWRPEAIPEHLRMNFRVVAEDGVELAAGRDLEDLRRRLRQAAHESFQRLPRQQFERAGCTDWVFGTLPAALDLQRQGVPVLAYPALVDERETVAMRLFDVEPAAAAAHRAGLRRLFLLRLGQQVKYLRKQLPLTRETCLQYLSVARVAPPQHLGAAVAGPASGRVVGARPCEELAEQVIEATVERLFLADPGAIRAREAFEAALVRGRGGFVAAANEVADLVADALREYHSVVRRLDELAATNALEASVEDIREQLRQLVHQGFVRATPWAWLRQLPRYLRALQRRLDKCGRQPERDAAQAQLLRSLWSGYLELASRGDATAEVAAALEQLRWSLEELRVSLFAQELKTAFPISVKRVQAQLQALRERA